MIYNIVASSFIKAIQLNEHEKKVVVIKLTPRYTGVLKINAVVGKISVSDFVIFFNQVSHDHQADFNHYSQMFRRQPRSHPAYGENLISKKPQSNLTFPQPPKKRCNSIRSWNFQFYHLHQPYTLALRQFPWKF